MPNGGGAQYIWWLTWAHTLRSSGALRMQPPTPGQRQRPPYSSGRLSASITCSSSCATWQQSQQTVNNKKWQFEYVSGLSNYETRYWVIMLLLWLLILLLASADEQEMECVLSNIMLQYVLVKYHSPVLNNNTRWIERTSLWRISPMGCVKPSVYSF